MEMTSSWKPWVAVGDGRMLQTQNDKKKSQEELDRKKLIRERVNMAVRSRMRRLTDKEYEERREKRRIYHRLWRNSLTGEKREAFLAKKRERGRRIRESYSDERKKANNRADSLKRKGSAKRLVSNAARVERLKKQLEEKRKLIKEEEWKALELELAIEEMKKQHDDSDSDSGISSLY
ncbi:hypothetical protein QR680_012163 [Steinernema hermaphroditum]|uniref:Uncharacterized protein n=1 Tax=Steinernema hermaphroditum TaxID=289476 RepID=A0AA39I3U4_9BILA|nr:hypothetical protein QR680_012163 [Steinernema hermaphroditum]